MPTFKDEWNRHQMKVKELGGSAPESPVFSSELTWNVGFAAPSRPELLVRGVGKTPEDAHDDLLRQLDGKIVAMHQHAQSLAADLETLRISTETALEPSTPLNPSGGAP